METTAIPVETEIEDQNKEAPLADIQPKTRFTGKIVKTSLAGAIVDIGWTNGGCVGPPGFFQKRSHRADNDQAA